MDPQSQPKSGKGKVRPTGKLSARPAGKPGNFSRSGEFATIPSPPCLLPSATLPGAPDAFFEAGRNLSGPMWSEHQNQTPERSRAASRWSAPSPGSRTRREDRAPSHRPQMSSGRLFLDRVGRHQSPSPLHRHEQINMHSLGVQSKGDISTLPGRATFLFCLDRVPPRLDPPNSICDNDSEVFDLVVCTRLGYASLRKYYV